MDDMEESMLRLRRLGYRVSMQRRLFEGEDEAPSVFVVRHEKLTIQFDALLGIQVLPDDGLVLDRRFNNKKRFHLSYPFDEQSYFLQMKMEQFVEMIVRYVSEAVSIAAGLPERFRP